MVLRENMVNLLIEFGFGLWQVAVFNSIHQQVFQTYLLQDLAQNIEYPPFESLVFNFPTSSAIGGKPHPLVFLWRQDSTDNKLLSGQSGGSVQTVVPAGSDSQGRS